MKTSWNETAQIETHISGSHAIGDALLFEANLLLDPELQDKVLWQKHTYAVINNYGRRQLKNDLEAIHQKLFTSPEHAGFRERIKRLFTNQ